MADLPFNSGGFQFNSIPSSEFNVFLNDKPARREQIANHSTDDEYQVVKRAKKMGGGFNAGIAIVRRRVGGQYLAKKNFGFRRDRKEDPRAWHREMKLLRSLQHLNVCAFVDGFVTSTRGGLFMEFCDFGNLTDFKEQMFHYHERVPEAFAWHVLKSLTKALCYIHTGFKTGNEILESPRGKAPGWDEVIHRDMKLDNVFLKVSGQDHTYPIVKLGDFGLSLAGEEHRGDYYSPCGCEGWLPPEYPNGGMRGDVFGLGAVVQCLCSQAFSKVNNIYFGMPRYYTVGLDRVVRTCMIHDKHRRPYAREVAKLIADTDDQKYVPYIPLPRKTFGDPLR